MPYGITDQDLQRLYAYFPDLSTIMEGGVEDPSFFTNLLAQLSPEQTVPEPVPPYTPGASPGSYDAPSPVAPFIPLSLLPPDLQVLAEQPSPYPAPGINYNLTNRIPADEQAAAWQAAFVPPPLDYTLQQSPADLQATAAQAAFQPPPLDYTPSLTPADLQALGHQTAFQEGQPTPGTDFSMEQLTSMLQVPPVGQPTAPPPDLATGLGAGGQPAAPSPSAPMGVGGGIGGAGSTAPAGGASAFGARYPSGYGFGAQGGGGAAPGRRPSARLAFYQ